MNKLYLFLICLIPLQIFSKDISQEEYEECDEYIGWYLIEKHQPKQGAICYLNPKYQVAIDANIDWTRELRGIFIDNHFRVIEGNQMHARYFLCGVERWRYVNQPKKILKDSNDCDLYFAYFYSGNKLPKEGKYCYLSKESKGGPIQELYGKRSNNGFIEFYPWRKGTRVYSMSGKWRNAE